MLRAIRLLFPALMPSWAFFQAVEPSPRVQWRFLQNVDDPAPPWHEFRPRPYHVPPLSILGRLFWNPQWNESLYLVSLAERLMLAPSDHSVQEINRCLMAEVLRDHNADDLPALLQFRLVFVSREETGITETETYLAAPVPVGGAR